VHVFRIVTWVAFVFAGAGAALAAEDSQMAALQRLLDKAEIEAVVARYVTALDTLDADAYEGVFAPDAEYNVTGTVYKGRAAIRKIVTDLQASRARNDAEGKPSPRLYHVMSNSSIEILDATHARHQSYAQTVRLADNGQFVVGFMGRYDDALVKVDGRWLIESRKLESFIPPAAAPAR
jgi:3-phenylpropionate/cinnamic acid dioxygenase small subunit